MFNFCRSDVQLLSVGCSIFVGRMFNISVIVLNFDCKEDYLQFNSAKQCFQACNMCGILTTLPLALCAFKKKISMCFFLVRSG